MNGEEAYFLSRAFTKNYSPSASNVYTKAETNTLLSAKADADAVTTKISTAQAHSLTPTGEGKGFVKHIYGMSEQDGTPTPTDPVLIEDSLGNFTVTDSDATNTQTITTGITLRAIEVTSSDAYNLEYNGKYYIADSIDWVDGTGYVLTTRIASYTTVGTETMVVTALGEANQRYTVQAGLTSNTGAFIASNMVKGSGVTDTWGYLRLSGSGNSAMTYGDAGSTHEFATLADFTTWLTANPTTINYALATPTTSTLTTSQITALLGLVTYDEATNITPTAEPYPVSVVEYGESRVASLAISNHNEVIMKADSADTYTKTETDTLLADKVDKTNFTVTTGSGTIDSNLPIYSGSYVNYIKYGRVVIVSFDLRPTSDIASVSDWTNLASLPIAAVSGIANITQVHILSNGTQQVMDFKVSGSNFQYYNPNGAWTSGATMRGQIICISAN